MKTSEIFYLINEIETKFPVNEWKFNGIRVWPFVRIKLFSDLVNYYNFSSKKTVVVNIFIRYFHLFLKEMIKLSKVFLAYVFDFSKNEKSRGHVDVIFLSDGVSYVKVEDKYYERFCDPVREQLYKLGMTSKMFCPSVKLNIPRYYKSSYIKPKLFILIFLKFWLKSYKNFNLELERYSECNKFLVAKGLPIKMCNIKELKKNFVRIMYVSEFFKKKLILYKPKFCMQVSYYSMLGYSFNLACFQLGIQCVDIQHGVQGDLHRAYGRWCNVPPSGYEILPSIFWCWRETDVNAINNWALNTKRHIAILGGNLFLEKFRQKDKTIANVLNLEKNNKYLYNYRHVMYSLTGFETINDINNILSLVIKTNNNFFWWIRCHPCFLDKIGFLKKRILERRISNVDIIKASRLPLYYLLPNMDIHVTESSSIVIEAKAFGIPSIITTKYGREFYNNEIYEGWAKYANSNKEIISLLISLSDKKKSFVKNENNFDFNMGIKLVLRQISRNFIN